MTNVEGPGGIAVHLACAPFVIRLPVSIADRPLKICAWTDSTIFTREDVRSIFFGYGNGLAGCHFGAAELGLAKDGFNDYFGNRLEQRDDGTKEIFVAATNLAREHKALTAYSGTELYLLAYSEPACEYGHTDPLADLEYVVLQLS